MQYNKRDFGKIAKKIVCPLCGFEAEEFRAFGVKPRKNARCPHCGCVERHRLIWYYIQERRLLTDDCNLLDIAPTRALSAVIKTEYNLLHVSADLSSSEVNVQMNIEQMPFGYESFDGILCVHVLEHVKDDVGALNELFRVLKPEGWALINVPMNENAEYTDEDLGPIQPEEREKRFGQFDHLRIYGRDFIELCRLAGFSMEVVSPSVGVAELHGLLPRERILLGWKR
ncbi:methyltransferase domain-containing protein [Thiorhodovibrio litoralis]|uniref:methyltransferase domain-containing protein n=1 Tax=Thiorhodovibrio litoralis TaxID=2952932 RepID=UPI002B2590B7|nr:methyltransferase domain-containing protein [Thiorhodovibrio litoralis]WPL14164.1 Methyltransferase domain protein [Thiorhodovibrio litoralis]